MKKIKLSPLVIIIIAVVGVAVLVLVIWTVTKSLNKYSGKVVEISSTDGRLQGKVGLKASGKYLKAYYHILANDTFLMNNNCSNQIEDCQPNSSYDFAIDLVVPSDLGGEGSFLAVYCNKDKYPDNLFALDSSIYTQCPNESKNGQTTTFEATFSKDYQSYAEFESANKINIYDAANFWEVKKTDQSDAGAAETRTLNSDRAVQEGTKVRTYQLTFKQPS